jgi:hypothetical protein
MQLHAYLKLMLIEQDARQLLLTTIVNSRLPVRHGIGADVTAGDHDPVF